MTEQQTPDREKKIAEIREWHEGKRDSFPQFTVFEAVGVMLDEIDRIQQEYAEERAAHNAHVAQLCQAEEENRKRFVKIAELVSQRERLTKENRKLREERDKLIEGLRSIRNELD